MSKVQAAGTFPAICAIIRSLMKLVFLMIIASYASLFAQQAPNDVVCPDDHSYTGLRENWTFGFSIVIPENLRGYWNSPSCHKTSDGCACMGDHGTVIPLSTRRGNRGNQIEFYAELDSSEEHTLSALVEQHLARLKTRPTLQRSIRYGLAGLSAQRVVAYYYDREQKARVVEDFIVALRGGTAYDLYLHTSEANYPHDLGIFNRLLRSFTLTKGEYNDTVPVIRRR